MKIKTSVLRALLFVALCLFPAALFAADAVVGGDASASSDKLVAALTPVIVPLILALAKKGLPMLPSWSIPLLAPVLGLLIGVVTSVLVAHPTLPWWAGGALGIAGIGLREIKDKLLPAANGGWPANAT